MSLAQTLERAPMGSVSTPPRVSMPPSVELRAVPRHATVLQPAVVAPVEPAPGNAQSDAALDLLTEVSSALPKLLERSRMLEQMLTTTRDQAKAELEAANDVAREWQQMAQNLKNQVEHLEQRVAGSEQRADAAEQRAVAAQSRADQAQRAAEKAERLSALLQDKVIKAFGAGSAGESILESVRGTKRAGS